LREWLEFLLVSRQKMRESVNENFQSRAKSNFFHRKRNTENEQDRSINDLANSSITLGRNINGFCGVDGKKRNS
jgi:hypothetical protein